MLQVWGVAVRELALTIENGLLPWVNLNYADKSWQPLASYGAGNIRNFRMWRRSMMAQGLRGERQPVVLEAVLSVDCPTTTVLDAGRISSPLCARPLERAGVDRAAIGTG